MNLIPAESLYWLVLLLFIIALIYSSAGFGGGTSYIAILALSGISYKFIPVTALFWNIIVVSFGTYVFKKNGYLKLNRIVPFLIGSIPAVFVGGLIPISEKVFFLFLGTSLLFASIHAGFLKYEKEIESEEKKAKHESKLMHGAVGFGIGFISGITGIGGGIFLSPVLYFLRFAPSKEIAAMCSFFILINSIIGISAQLIKLGNIDYTLGIEILPLAFAVLFGSIIGSNLTVYVLPTKVIRYVAALLTFYAGVRVILK